MTDEEKAIDYICNEYYEANKKGFTDKEKIILREEIKENDKKKIKLYLAGLAEGRKERNCVNCSNHGKQFEVMKLEKEIAELKELVNKQTSELMTRFFKIKRLNEKISVLEKENAELKAENKQIVERERVVPEHYLCEMIAKNKELKAQIEKMKNFIFEEIDFCFYCPLTDTCRNDEGTCPYANITEEEQKNLLSDWITK